MLGRNPGAGFAAGHSHSFGLAGPDFTGTTVQVGAEHSPVPSVTSLGEREECTAGMR